MKIIQKELWRQNKKKKFVLLNRNSCESDKIDQVMKIHVVQIKFSFFLNSHFSAFQHKCKTKPYPEIISSNITYFKWFRHFDCMVNEMCSPHKNSSLSSHLTLIIPTRISDCLSLSLPSPPLSLSLQVRVAHFNLGNYRHNGNKFLHTSSKFSNYILYLQVIACIVVYCIQITIAYLKQKHGSHKPWNKWKQMEV